MSGWVLDASVLAKLVYPEEGSDEVHGVLEGGVSAHASLHAPAFLAMELASIGTRKSRRGEAGARETRELLQLPRRLGVTLHEDAQTAPIALELALGLGTSVYDAAYLAVAETVDGTVMTADRRLVRKVLGTGMEHRVQLVVEMPRTGP